MAFPPEWVRGSDPEAVAFQANVRTSVAPPLDTMRSLSLGSMATRLEEVSKDAVCLDHESETIWVSDHCHRYSYSQVSIPSLHLIVTGRAFSSTHEPVGLKNLNDSRINRPVSPLPSRELSFVEVDMETSPERGYMYGPVVYRHVRGNREPLNVEVQVCLDALCDAIGLECDNDRERSALLDFVLRLTIQDKGLTRLLHHGPWDFLRL
jgi:hypothetical protein